MKIYDISLPISQDLPVWPGDPPIELTRQASISAGSDANVSRLACGVHMGTHVDAPLHFVDGAESVDQFNLSTLIGRVHVVDLRGETAITAAKLEAIGITRRARRVIFKTDNSQLWHDEQSEFFEDYVALQPDAAEWLVDSIAPFHDGVPTHRILLKAGIVILEGLNLWSIPSGRYTLYCLPLNLKGSDGAPARVILIGP
jgi:arylformamidase